MSVTALEPAYYSKREIAVKFSCSTRFIERRMAEGMPHFHLGKRARFRFAECERWLIDHGHLTREES